MRDKLKGIALAVAAIAAPKVDVNLDRGFQVINSPLDEEKAGDKESSGK